MGESGASTPISSLPVTSRVLAILIIEAEQARRGHTNSYIAQKLCITKKVYESKKKNGNFKPEEAKHLVLMYWPISLEYLFAVAEEINF